MRGARSGLRHRPELEPVPVRTNCRRTDPEPACLPGDELWLPPPQLLQQDLGVVTVVSCPWELLSDPLGQSAVIGTLEFRLVKRQRSYLHEPATLVADLTPNVVGVGEDG